MKIQYGFLINLEKCTGCKTCQLSCKDYKDLPVDVNFRRVYEYCGGTWQELRNTWINSVFSYYVSIACNHCEDSICTQVCPSGAMHKRSEDNFIIINNNICIGCKSCSMACPYDAPQYNSRLGHMTKCNGCLERFDLGLNPICVQSCPLRALDFGPIDKLRKKYGDLAAVAPLPTAHYTSPNLVIVPNQNARPPSDVCGLLGNPKEV